VLIKAYSTENEALLLALTFFTGLLEEFYPSTYELFPSSYIPASVLLYDT
jgi:hypothetical protein